VTGPQSVMTVLIITQIVRAL